MPIYEYRCELCNTRFEELVPAQGAPAPPCQECGSRSVVRVYSTFATEWKPSIVNWHRMPGRW